MDYPRMLFPGGEEGEYLIVHSAEEEARARANGYATYGQRSAARQEPAEAPKRRGRPPKPRDDA